ncbi:MAG: A24 family peptidase [archaeon]
MSLTLFYSLIFFILTSFFDLKYHKIPRELNYFFLSTGIIINFYPQTFFVVLLSFLSFYVLYKIRLVGGGDVKFFTAASALMPCFSICFYPFLAILQALILFFPLASAYVISFAVLKNREKFFKSLKSSKLALILCLTFLFFSLFEIAYFPAFLISTYFFLFFHAFKSSKDSIFTFETEPREGLILAEEIKVGKYRIIPKASGISEKEAQILKEHFKKVKVKRSFPLAFLLSLGFLYGPVAKFLNFPCF